LLNASYKKGCTVPRQIPQSDGSFKTEFFEVFGFRGLAGTHQLPPTLASRSLIFRMRKAIRKLKLFINEDQCTEIRNKLLAYRFAKMLNAGHEGDEGASRREGGDIEQFATQLETGRLAELFYCLWKVAPTEELKKKIISYANNMQKERLEELATSDEGLCLSSIFKCYQTGKITHGLILIKDIAEEINNQMAYNETWTNRKVGSICSRLGFRKAMSRQKTTCIKWDETLIENLKKDPRYTSCFEQTELPPTSQNAPSSPASPDSNYLLHSKEIDEK